METKPHPPSFTVSLRGYDREEVNEYLDSLAEALRNVEDAEERNRRLQTHVTRLNARVKDLEERIRTDTPRTGSVLGERIAILLSAAEEAATDTINRAEVKAAESISAAEHKLSGAEEEVRLAVAKGEDQARRVEAEARTSAAEIVSEAEARAAARTRQIEQWAEDVVARTRAEDARMQKEQQLKHDAATAELDALVAKRDRVAATLGELRESLGHAIGLASGPTGVVAPGSSVTTLTGEHPVTSDPPQTGPGGQAAAATPFPAGREQPFSGERPLIGEAGAGDQAPASQVAAAANVVTGWHPAVVFDDIHRPGEALTPEEAGPEDQARTDDTTGGSGSFSSLGSEGDFDVKLEAWVSDGAKHFRKD